MKKLLFTLCAATLSTMMVNGQTRLSLYEEFSGENCGPCAQYNPGLWTLLSGNTSKVMLIKYQCPIPTAGPIYNAYKTVTNARLSYYAVSSAPFGIQNGNEVKGNVANYTQADIDASVTNPAPFTMTVSHTWNAAGDSVTANVSITSSSAYSPTGANLKLRVALIEHLDYCTPPGNNGETEFHNVVREMYPDAAGTSIPNTWTASQNHTLSIKGKVPDRVDKSNKDAIIVVWIQNDADKHILQATTSTKVSLPVDASLNRGCVPQVLACATGSASIPTAASLTNTGATTLTSATIYYKLDNGTLTSTTWAGSLAPGGSTSVSIPAMTMTTGEHVVYDSIALLNGNADVNLANNVEMQAVLVHDKNPVTMPVSTDFENGGAVPTNWSLYDVDGNSSNWLVRPMTAHSGSAYALMFANYYYPAGEVNYAVLPTSTLPSGSKALDFYLAYAQFQNENDELAVVYSTDCGSTWNTVWSKSGADLKTHDPVNPASFVPVEEDWRLKSIDMSSVPANAMIAFRGTSDYGNNLYIDDVNLRAGEPTGIRSNVIAASEMSLYPNPAVESATLSFTLASSSKVTISVVDAVGRTIAVVADASMQQGKQKVVIPTSNLAPGVYNIAIRTAEGVSSQRLSVVK